MAITLQELEAALAEEPGADVQEPARQRTVDEWEAEMAGDASFEAVRERMQLRNESSLFGFYAAAVRRALVAVDRATPRNVDRARWAIGFCARMLDESPSTNNARRRAALQTLDLLALQVTDSEVAHRA